jgi:putative transcriptional regulator
LEKYEAQRDLGADLVRAIREMKAGQGRVVTSPVIEARKKTGLSQSQFAALLGVSERCKVGSKVANSRVALLERLLHCEH